MRRLLNAGLLAFAVGFALAWAAPAPAMQQSDSPAKFNVPWANAAVAPYVRNIPQASQIGVQNCAASLTDGFPPLTFVPASAGGCPPFGADFNGILKQITQWSRWGQASGPVFYNSAFSAAIGGYPKGAMLQSSVLVGRVWMSTADNNATNPDAQDGTAANWIVQPGTAYPSQLIQTFGIVAQPPNTVSANGLTVGNGSSNATGRANADTYWLFVRLWTDCTNVICQLYNSSGGAISRGASANADWAANNAIATYSMGGTATIAADQQGSVVTSRLAGVPSVIGSSTVPTSVFGENLHALVSAENGSHTHSITDAGHVHTASVNLINSLAPNGPGSGSVGVGASTSVTVNNAVTGISINSSGSGTPHNTVPRSILTANWLAL